jgi:proprotein convertase subtilisin/kexin type 5
MYGTACTTACVSPCGDCIGDSALECLTCASGFVSRPIAGSTLVQCDCEQPANPPAKWFDWSDATCKDCHKSCLTCEGPDQYSCFTCHEDSHLIRTATTDAKGLCQCKYGIARDANGECIAQSTSKYCGVKEYQGTTACEACHYKCQTCNGGAVTECASCPPGAYMTTEGECRCQPGSFMDSAGLCQSCIPNCTSCNSAS